MARYIDAEAVCEALKSMASVQLPDKQSTILGVVSSIENFPTADVAPRAEVAREIILEVDMLICCHANGDIDDRRLYLLFDKLKKKYTEETP